MTAFADIHTDANLFRKNLIMSFLFVNEWQLLTKNGLDLKRALTQMCWNVSLQS